MIDEEKPFPLSYQIVITLFFLVGGYGAFETGKSLIQGSFSIELNLLFLLVASGLVQLIPLARKAAFVLLMLYLFVSVALGTIAIFWSEDHSLENYIRALVVPITSVWCYYVLLSGKVCELYETANK